MLHTFISIFIGLFKSFFSLGLLLYLHEYVTVTGHSKSQIHLYYRKVEIQQLYCYSDNSDIIYVITFMISYPNNELSSIRHLQRLQFG